MNAVEIEAAVSDLSQQPFDRAEFPFAFLLAFGNKETTIRRLRSGASNKSDVGGVLQTNNIHIAACSPGEVTTALDSLRASPATIRAKARFILATDGTAFEAEDLVNGEAVACAYRDFPDHFGFFLSLAGITTVKQIRESSFDIRATSRLNRLYVELRKDNPEWGSAERRHDMNHFMARLIFCFFAEDTDIFDGTDLFTDTVERMSDASNTHEVIGELFRAMNTKAEERAKANLARWAERFPHVNGGLFSDSLEVPRFSRIARRYLLRIGSLDWTKINPDIFGSMIQAVADEEERGTLGMHYTSVPNILKVLNPLFLDDLRARLSEAGDNPRTLLNLRKRIAKIRVFDPACGSGNFLVIAYKQMREIENVINVRRGDVGRKSDIPLTNFRGIELRDFPAEIARLALIIAEYQCDVLYRGQKEALAAFLPLDADSWITCDNALRLDWLSICPPTGLGVRTQADDLFPPPNSAEIDFANEGGEIYICGNPPYAGLSSQTAEQKDDLKRLFEDKSKYWKSYDYVMGWFWKAREFVQHQAAKAAFVATNSICQGQLVPMFWPMILDGSTRIFFAHSSFRWRNLAASNAGVTVVIVGLSCDEGKAPRLFEASSDDDDVVETAVPNINAYIVPGPTIYVQAVATPPPDRPVMYWGNKPTDGGNLILSLSDARQIRRRFPESEEFLRSYFGSEEFIKGVPRVCIWIEDARKDAACAIPEFFSRIGAVGDFRAKSKAKETRPAAAFPHRFRQVQGTPGKRSIIVPIHSSESRRYLPVGLLSTGSIVSNAAYALYDAPLWSLAVIASRLHLVWIATVCGKIKTDFRYSSTLGWNTFPIPLLTDKSRADLTRCAEDILLAREAHFPASIADLYEADSMPTDLREAHERNDEVLERIYIGRRFRNDTERLEKLFELYTKMTGSSRSTGKNGKAEVEA
jgi:hypothetical protein